MKVKDGAEYSKTLQNDLAPQKDDNPSKEY